MIFKNIRFLFLRIENCSLFFGYQLYIFYEKQKNYFRKKLSNYFLILVLGND